MTLLKVAVIVLLVLALICLIAPTTIAGANWSVWLVSALLAWALDTVIPTVIVRRPSAKQEGI